MLQSHQCLSHVCPPRSKNPSPASSLKVIATSLTSRNFPLVYQLLDTSGSCQKAVSKKGSSYQASLTCSSSNPNLTFLAAFWIKLWETAAFPLPRQCRHYYRPLKLCKWALQFFSVVETNNFPSSFGILCLVQLLDRGRFLLWAALTALNPTFALACKNLILFNRGEMPGNERRKKKKTALIISEHGQELENKADEG